MVIPNVPEAKLAEMQAEPIFQRFPIHAGELASQSINQSINLSIYQCVSASCLGGFRAGGERAASADSSRA